MVLQKEILPKEFTDIVNTGYYEEEGGILITKINCVKEDVNIRFILDSGDEDIPKQIWELEVKELKAEKISLQWANDIAFYDDHFLLSEYTDNIVSLYFNGSTEAPEKLYVDICEIHRKDFQSRIEIEKYLNECMSFKDLCTSNHGLFAQGPKRILGHYFSCLEKYNKNPHYLPVFESGHKYNIDKSLGLLMIGRSYFIGEEFSFHRVDEN